MPDKRSHRGAHPEDGELFADERLPVLRTAVAELSWLLSRGYAEKGALKLVGDHHQLHQRQRTAVMRCSCSDTAREHRAATQLAADTIRNRSIAIDGYNVLTSVEAALGGGALLIGRDGCLRDMASMHGSYRKVSETEAAIAHIGEALAGLGVADCKWYLDAPVSNSGRLKTILYSIAETHRWPWQVEIVASPDHELISSPLVAATADSVVLDRCGDWFNLARYVVATLDAEPWLVDLSSG